jgi:hypothetical protein
MITSINERNICLVLRITDIDLIVKLLIKREKSEIHFNYVATSIMYEENNYIESLICVAILKAYCKKYQYKVIIVSNINEIVSDKNMLNYKIDAYIEMHNYFLDINSTNSLCIERDKSALDINEDLKKFQLSPEPNPNEQKVHNMIDISEIWNRLENLDETD